MTNKIYYHDGYKYQLAEDYFHVLNEKFDLIKPFDFAYFSFNPSILLIRRGYAWDGASGPTIDTKCIMRGSLVHDVLYQILRLQLMPLEMKKECDLEFRRICIEDGTNEFRANYFYQGVKVFGASSTKNIKPVIVAP